MEPTRQSLLGRLRDSADEAAWREFDATYRELLVRFCRRAGLQAADAEDVRQTVMLSLSRALPEFAYRPERGRFRDFLFAVVRNAVRKHWARQDRHGEVLFSDATAVGAAAVPADVAAELTWNTEWMLHHYRRAMERIRATFERESVEVFDSLLEGVSGEEVARRRGMTPAAVYKVKQRIRDRLRELIERQLRDEEAAAEPFDP